MQWVLKTLKIKDLKPYYKNPRSLSKSQFSHLKTSLDKFGLIDKPIVTKDNLIIGGHQRLKVLSKSNVEEVECWVADQELKEKDLQELNIRLNKNQGDWDFDILSNQWELSDLISWGFTEKEIPIPIDVTEFNDEDEGTLNPTENPKTVLGDIYQLGNHRLICGDATSPEVVSALLGDNTPVLMVTDPPYGVNYDPDWRGKAGKGQKASGKVQNDDQVDWSIAWSLFPGSIAYVWHAGKFCSKVEDSLIEADFEIISQIIWAKQQFALSRGDYHWQHEPCWYAVKKGHKHNWQGSRKESTVWEISNLNAFGTNKEDERTSHSTQKPIECMRKPILNNTAEGEGVYDPFCGSGTTLIAAEQTGRNAFCIELDPAYCDLIVDRWTKFMLKNGKEPTVILNDKQILWEYDA